MKERTGRGPGGSAWSQIFNGTTGAKHSTIQAFADAFELTRDEMDRLAHVYTFDQEQPEGATASLSYEEVTEEHAAVEREGVTLAEWVGERVRAYMETGEEVQGTLRSVFEHGIAIDRRARPPSPSGPCYYSWRIVQWLDPLDRQTTRR